MIWHQILQFDLMDLNESCEFGSEGFGKAFGRNCHLRDNELTQILLPTTLQLSNFVILKNDNLTFSNLALPADQAKQKFVEFSYGLLQTHVIDFYDNKNLLNDIEMWAGVNCLQICIQKYEKIWGKLHQRPLRSTTVGWLFKQELNAAKESTMFSKLRSNVEKIRRQDTGEKRVNKRERQETKIRFERRYFDWQKTWRKECSN
jgi:hypothetical protein